MTTTPPTDPHGLAIHHALTRKREESASEDMCSTVQGTWNMSGQRGIAEGRAMRWMIVVILNLLAILTAAFLAGAVQALPTQATRDLPAVIVVHPSGAATTAAKRASGVSGSETLERSEPASLEPGGKVDAEAELIR